MTVVSTTKDPEALRFTIVADFAAPPARVWQVWADARQLERWWGPPTWPATFTRHEMVLGGISEYYMTGPEGEKAHGWWETVAVQPPRTFEFDDGFADENGDRDATMPVVRAQVELEDTTDGTRMSITSRFASTEHMEQLTNMGMVEGMTEAMGQIDAILAET
ncbi:SRPBCC domain-containing protein [Sanguibacter sp. 25GB23B1]|uniref:SRPBCC family protein n=1 Tax=unclassified Sanguibacter TaxID=2645534 RepID=UPI0032B0057A